MEEANLSLKQLTEVILVGGQTRMPLIRRSVEDFFNRSISIGVNPDTAVAEGAAREGAMLKHGKGVLLLDVTPISLGINIAGNRFYSLIPRNSKVPVRKEHMFTTHRDAQTRARMVILQGDNPVASENVKLGEVILENLQGFERFQTRIKVAFEIDNSGILHVKAFDEDTREEKEITIRDSFDREGKETANVVPEVESLVPSDGDAPPTFSGPFHETELIDVLCFLHANEKTGRFVVVGKGQPGILFLNNGEVTHAKLDQQRGLEAAKTILGITEGRYAFHEGVASNDPPEIEVSFDSLVK